LDRRAWIVDAHTILRHFWLLSTKPRPIAVVVFSVAGLRVPLDEPTNAALSLSGRSALTTLALGAQDRMTINEY